VGEKVSTLTVSWQTGETRTEKTWEVWLSEERAESGQPEGCCGEGLTNDAEITDTNIQSVETLQSSGDTKQRESVMSYTYCTYADNVVLPALAVAAARRAAIERCVLPAEPTAANLQQRVCCCGTDRQMDKHCTAA